MRKKRGDIYFGVILSLIFLTVILPLAYNSSLGIRNRFTKYIGESQVLLLKTYEKGERALYYIDRAAFLSLSSEAYKQALSGGANGTDCKRNGDYIIWNSKEKPCYPEKTAENLIASFEKAFKEYLSAYPDEPIPELEYEYKLVQKENLLQIVGLSKSTLRIDIGENDNMNFRAEAIKEPVKEEEPVQEEPGPEPEPGDWKCQTIADYAKKYIGCAYALDDLSGAYSPPEYCDRTFNKNSNGATYTCAGLTSSVVYNLYHVYYNGNGRDKCEQSEVHKIGTDPAKLKPGDIFASEVRCSSGADWCRGGYTTAGHTGIYIGRGSVSRNAYGRITCYLDYKYDPNGEYVFIHSNGGSEHGQPGVCYATYSQLFQQTNVFVLKDFCRLNFCGA